MHYIISLNKITKSGQFNTIYKWQICKVPFSLNLIWDNHWHKRNEVWKYNNFKVSCFPHRGSYRITHNNLYFLLSDEFEHLDNCAKKKKKEREIEKGRTRVRKNEVKLLSHVWLFAIPWTVAYQAPPYFPSKSTEVGCCFLLQGIFPTQGLNPGLLYHRQMLYPLSHRETQERMGNTELHGYASYDKASSLLSPGETLS